MTKEDEVRIKLFGKKNNSEIEELNTCPGCGNQFRRYVGDACTMACYYRNIL